MSVCVSPTDNKNHGDSRHRRNGQTHGCMRACVLTCRTRENMLACHHGCYCRDARSPHYNDHQLELWSNPPMARLVGLLCLFALNKISGYQSIFNLFFLFLFRNRALHAFSLRGVRELQVCDNMIICLYVLRYAWVPARPIQLYSTSLHTPYRSG